MESELFLDDYGGNEVDDDMSFFEDDEFLPDIDPEDTDELNLDELDDDLDHDARDDLVDLNQQVETTLKNPQSEAAFRTRRGLTKYEKTALIGIRAEQLRRNAPPNVSIEDWDPLNKVVRLMTNEIEIAKKELGLGVLPMTVDRPLPSKVPNRPIYEIRPISTLIHSTNPDF